MKNFINALAGLLLVAVGLFSCQPNEILLKKSSRAATELTAAGTGIDFTDLTRESPFNERNFSPFLGEKWIGNGISYGCYRAGQAPGEKGPSEAEILEDLNIISHYWNLIRVYGSDADSERVLKVIHDNELPIRVMLGIWLANETKHPERKPLNQEQVEKGIELANRFSAEVIAINVGNESQVEWSWHHMEAENLIRYIRMVRNSTKTPVTTADDYNFWNKPHSKAVAAEIDFIVLHAYPLWNGKTLDIALSWTDSIYQAALAFHPDKIIALGETGWATDYNADKKGPGEQGSLVKGEVSHKAQEQFLLQLNAWINKNNVTTFWFEAFDEPWKGGGLQTGLREIEKNWGLFYESRQPKPAFENYLKLNK
ncbi:MAG: glycosyl hydrolase family 17 [Candidatus Marinimicrobia bacterium]|jgi:exo-beta-1,3-glucanase (GH17 family)|nr:glycosyl hydrolase family 17 [Candidatus Neomarinimicrobiota bacterium]MBT3630785.1 glycosyl hydrolase family 17 [Candidatus Neomarinimicrobiota bacterium]MBT3825587.1 glycosyl hydrolase family 17 [Candidatus Neomarinimicrobiota bacterium]MBT4131193.1 glycosyl hydrolase family 17 [Candidatus Neomarinimicrobiota bacterium]MBT4296347.1 glycosyl hydrolase family 17 [Candidatus Neomarinimicrobiota bacterium]